VADVARVCQATADGLRIRLRVQPRSARNRIAGVHGEALKICVTAPPVDGAANAAVIAILAEALGVAKSRITIVTGATGRDKQVMVGASSPAVIAKLEAAMGCVDKPKVGD
jgi:uncharacterized protein